jgi:hypothetical protein
MLAIFLANRGRKSKDGLKSTYPRFQATCARGKQYARSDDLDQRARINGAQRIPDPPCLPTFKLRGGGPESGAHLSDGPDERARINGGKGHSGPPPPFSL